MGGRHGKRFPTSTPSTPAACDIRGMSCMNAIDTNILVYSFDRDEPAKRTQAVRLIDYLVQEDVETVLLWQVAAEFLCCLRRWEIEKRINRQEMLGNLEHLDAMFRCVLPTQAILWKSLDLSSRYSMSHWDSLLVAACIEAGVQTLYSEDLASDMKYDTVTVVNPFAL
jgi:predicted nucleic acid-binding protein